MRPEARELDTRGVGERTKVSSKFLKRSRTAAAYFGFEQPVSTAKPHTIHFDQQQSLVSPGVIGWRDLMGRSKRIAGQANSEDRKHW